MPTHARGRPRISAAFCGFAVLLALLAVLPGCGCGDDSRDAAAADAGPDPCAPPAVNAIGAVSFADAVRFLYDGACPRQTGVDKTVFDDLRVSVVRGHVVGEDGETRTGVRVSVPREGRYGETRTGADGGFDSVVNGGSRTRLRFELDGHLFAQRSADAKTNRFLVLDEIALVQKSATATSLSFGDGASWQVAIGDVSKDESAERRVRLLVPPGTKASAVKPDGTRQPLSTGTLRMTEFTRGAHGPAAMPSELPPASGYTYASSFLFDEAGPDAHIEFDSPVIAYLDNFLGMKAGASVPSGALDEGADGWHAEPSGRVVKLVGGATPSLDANGDDVPDSPAELAALGVTPEELAGGNVLDVALTYDALSRIVDKVANGAAWHYDYDVRGRLTRVRKDGADVATYSYDANGNRTDGAAVLDAQDRVTSMNGATYTYSAAGERLTRTTGAGQTVYTYDGRGHLSSVTVPGGLRADYDLDAYGRRVTKRRNGTVPNRFLYRNALQPAAEVDDQGALLSRYVYARGELGPDALERGGATYLLLKDERGSIRFVIDATSGAVAQALVYDAFGRVLSDSSPGFQPFGFAGGIYDADTGLVHFGARDYDPDTGSFTRKDPSRFGGGENL